MDRKGAVVLFYACTLLSKVLSVQVSDAIMLNSSIKI